MFWRVATICTLLCSAAFAQAEERRWHGLSPFEMQDFVAAERSASAIVQRGDPAAAIKAFDLLIKRYPRVARVHANRAILLAVTGKTQDAIAGLEDAAKLGFKHFSKFADQPALAQVMASERVQVLLAKAGDPGPEVIFSPAEPAKAKANQLVIREANVDYLPNSDMLLIRTSFPKRPFSRSVATAKEPWASRINRLHARGLAAGNHGDIYENRDNGHSNFKLKEFPQVTKMTYAEGIDAIYKLSRGLNLRVIADAIVFGNSSTAYKQRPFSRSLVRWAMTQPGAAQRLFTQHRANQIYVYPEVRDFEAGYDYFPGYFADQIVSEGRSGSDRLPMKGIALALAAFRPEVKAELKKRNMISPVVASILRRSVPGSENPLSDFGHRSALKGDQIDFMKVIKLAQSVTLNTIPPRVLLRVEAEPKLTPAQNVFAPLISEAIYTTPTSIARRAYGMFGIRNYRLRALTERGGEHEFEWRILAGDPNLISINPLDDKHQQVALKVQWHDPFTTAEGETTSRVDIGVFAKNEAIWSSPAVFSLYFSPKETRIHDEDGRLLSVDFADRTKKKTYADPRLTFQRDWKDQFIYRDGQLEGWHRIVRKQRTRYSRNGDIVTELDALGRPIKGREAAYDVKSVRPGIRNVEVSPGSRAVGWVYSSPQDRIGERVYQQ